MNPERMLKGLHMQYAVECIVRLTGPERLIARVRKCCDIRTLEAFSVRYSQGWRSRTAQIAPWKTAATLSTCPARFSGIYPAAIQPTATFMQSPGPLR